MEKYKNDNKFRVYIGLLHKFVFLSFSTIRENGDNYKL